MRQRLHIARGLLHDPDVFFLDEPSIGIDPVGARELRATIAGLRDQGKTVLLTTHYMFEADELCDRIAVIRSGEIVAEGTPAELKGLVSAGRVLEVETYGVHRRRRRSRARRRRRTHRRRRGPRPAAGAGRRVRARRRGDPAGARAAGRDAGRPGQPPRARRSRTPTSSW